MKISDMTTEGSQIKKKLSIVLCLDPKLIKRACTLHHYKIWCLNDILTLYKVPVYVSSENVGDLWLAFKIKFLF